MARRRRLELLKRVADRIFTPLEDVDDVLLYNFMKAAPQPNWKVLTDADMGGKSTATFKWVNEAGSELLRPGQGAESISMNADIADTGTPEGEAEDEIVPNYARFTGVMSNVLPGDVAEHTTGFCATKSPELYPHSDLLEFEGLELLVRGDGRTYMLNMEPDTYFSQDLYQHLLQVMIPFERFILTAAGKFRDQQRTLEGGPRVKTFGLSVVDGEEGDFCLDVGYVKAVRSFEQHLEDIRKTQAKGKDRPTVW